MSKEGGGNRELWNLVSWNKLSFLGQGERCKDRKTLYSAVQERVRKDAGMMREAGNERLVEETGVKLVLEKPKTLW